MVDRSPELIAAARGMLDGRGNPAWGRRMLRTLLRYWPGLLWRLRRAASRISPHHDARERVLVAARPASSGGGVVVINRSRRELRLYDCAGDTPVIARSYRIGVGRPDSPTRVGDFSITAMLKDPVWFVPGNPRVYGALAGTQVPSGVRENRIRARWLGFDGGIGIHGTLPGPLGIGSSDGCVLMTVPDVIDLYDRLEPGVPVLVR